MKNSIALFSMLLASLAAHSQSTEPVNMTTEEVLALIKGKTIQTQNTRWGSVRLNFQENGTVRASGNGFNNKGAWKVEEGKLCLDGQKFDFEGCGAMRKVGGEIQHLWPKGEVHFTHQLP